MVWTLAAVAHAADTAGRGLRCPHYWARSAHTQARTAPVLNGPTVYWSADRPLVYRIPCTECARFSSAWKDCPASLKLDANSGILSGMSPAEKGNYRLVFRASNPQGHSDREFNIVVGDVLALTPPMGWNHWHIFYHFVTDAKIRAAADAMVASGMADVGYQYVCIDDCWMRVAPKAIAGATNRKRKTASKGLDVAAVTGPVRDEKGRVCPTPTSPT